MCEVSFSRYTFRSRKNYKIGKKEPKNCIVSADSGESEARAVTTVALIQAEFVIAPAADIGPMPKIDFRWVQ